MELDHWIVRVSDLERSVAFWTRTLGLRDEGREGPFAVLRVTPGLTVQLAPWGTEGHEHFAFALSRSEFDTTFARLQEDGVAYGDSFHDVGNMKGPGSESGARGVAEALYFFDPDRHLIEIRTYE